MFVGLVNSAQMHCTCKKSTFTAKQKSWKTQTQTQNANHPDPNAT